MHVLETPIHVHDFRATILHLLGFDPTKLTYRRTGRDYRLMDLHRKVAHEVLVPTIEATIKCTFLRCRFLKSKSISIVYARLNP